MRKGNGFWRFCFSLLPGAGEMYMGFMKQGVTIMAIFFGCCGLSGWLHMQIFALMLPVIWFYGFFHVHNLANMSDEEFYSQEDGFTLEDLKIFGGMQPEKARKYLALGLILIGCAGVWQIVTRWISNILKRYDISTQLWSEIVRNVPQIVFSILLIYIGVQLVKGKKKELENKEAKENDA